MTKQEAIKMLADAKVYVDGKSREIQEKLFSLGFRWTGGSKQVLFEDKPFLFIWKDMEICYSGDMEYFTQKSFREITANDILNIIIDEPKYRPFKNAEECWQEMQKHQPFGWIKKINGGYKQIMAIHIDIFNKHCADFAGQTGTASFELEYIYKNYTFTDGTPFGIKVEEE